MMSPETNSKAGEIQMPTKMDMTVFGATGTNVKTTALGRSIQRNKVIQMKVKIKKLHPDAVMPQYASSGAACFDLHALLEDGEVNGVFPGMPLVISTGLAFEIPEGHVMLVFSRSGHGFKNDVRLSNCVGVIDHDYRGEVKVKLANDQDEFGGLFVSPGDRIAQALIVPFPKVEFDWADELSDTERGEGGFGSTGS